MASTATPWNINKYRELFAELTVFLSIYFDCSITKLNSFSPYFVSILLFSVNRFSFCLLVSKTNTNGFVWFHATNININYYNFGNFSLKNV